MQGRLRGPRVLGRLLLQFECYKELRSRVPRGSPYIFAGEAAVGARAGVCAIARAIGCVLTENSEYHWPMVRVGGSASSSLSLTRNDFRRVKICREGAAA